MAVQRTLANPTVEVNNGVIGIIPNSLSYKRGKGDVSVRPQSAGGNSIEIIRTENAETKKSMVKFSLYNTKANRDLITAWQDLVDGAAIRLSDGDFIESFRSMFIINDPEMNLGADGNVEVTFEGQPAV
jgi:hypothetical protein